MPPLVMSLWTFVLLVCTCCWSRVLRLVTLVNAIASVALSKFARQCAQIPKKDELIAQEFNARERCAQN